MHMTVPRRDFFAGHSLGRNVVLALRLRRDGDHVAVSRILQAANFVAPHSGGIRTVLEHLADGYAAAGHEVIQVVPGERPAARRTAWGARITLPGLSLPGTGYRMLGLASVTRLLAHVAPDRIELHDRSTLRGLGQWARERGIPSLVVSHERLDRLLAQWLPRALVGQRLPDRSNAALAAGFDTVVCTTRWAAEEFARLPVGNVRQIPLGVDLTRFGPAARDAEMRARLTPDRAALLVLVSRLSREKRPELAVQAVAELVRGRQDVRLVVAGDGPMAARLRRLADGLPVTFFGHVGTDDVARLLATADVVLAPGPVETFGLAALEALASGTPVVANEASALREVLGADAGLTADGTPRGFAAAVQELLARPEADRRAAARQRAERYDWDATVAGFLTAHRLLGDAARAA
jgi:alpha-1,6-mannosyltransferase